METILVNYLLQLQGKFVKKIKTYFFMIEQSVDTLRIYKSMFLGSQSNSKKITSQDKGMSSRVVEFLNQVSMLPLFSLTFCQHANNQQMISPVAYAFSTGEIKGDK